MKSKVIKVLVFGTFDGIHDGHRYFLHEAKKCGDHLTAAVSEDSTTTILKRRSPTYTIEERVYALKKENIVDEIIEADVSIGTWQSVRKTEPNVICLGYDQINLKSALLKALPKFPWKIEVVTLEGFRTEEFHSSILEQKKNRNGAK